MSVPLKFALAWILALALPMQALAAATMLHCAQGPLPQAAPALHAHVGHHDAAAAEAGMAHDTAAHHVGNADDDGTHHCSACAACVAGAALPSAASVTLPIDAAGAQLVPPVSRECSVVLAGLERPPRSHLA